MTDVNRAAWTCTVETRHSDKSMYDVQALSPYHHYRGGEGFHHLPEVGAVVMVGWPSDNTPPFIMGYKGVPAQVTSSSEDTPAGASADGEPVDQAVSFRSGRPDMNPGDIGFTTRDGNFVILRRGGVLQLGATASAQRIYLPLLNYIKDFSENYSLNSFAGDVSWTVDRPESDPGGDAPATHVVHINGAAQDEKATVRIRHMSLPGEGDRSAWEVQVADKGIDRNTGVVENETYTLKVLVDGTKTEMSASRTVTVDGDDVLEVDGDRTVTVGGTSQLNANQIELVARGVASIVGSAVKLGASDASEPAPLGFTLVEWLAGAVWVVSGTSATLSPASLATLPRILASKTFVK